MPSLKSQPRTGIAKMRWSITKRIGRGLAADQQTGSTKLTWLQTSTAGPRSGMCSCAAHLEAVDRREACQRDEAQQELGHQQVDVKRDRSVHQRR